MKNKGLIIVICSSIVLVFATILYIFSLKNIDASILYKNWYHYDRSTGYYEIINIDNYKLSYYIPNNNNYTNEYSFCNKYKYNKVNKSIYLDCGKTMYLKKTNYNKLIVEVDGKEKVFFQNINDSKEYEFGLYFNSNTENYINNKKQSLEIIEINQNKLIELFGEKNYSKIIIIGDKCSTTECILIYDLAEKWMSFSTDIYYINLKNIDNITKINNILNVEYDYNNIYPTVMVVNNNKLIDLYEIKCSGFNCSMFYNK